MTGDNPRKPILLPGGEKEGGEVSLGWAAAVSLMQVKITPAPRLSKAFSLVSHPE